MSLLMPFLSMLTSTLILFSKKKKVYVGNRKGGGWKEASFCHVRTMYCTMVKQKKLLSLVYSSVPPKDIKHNTV